MRWARWWIVGADAAHQHRCAGPQPAGCAGARGDRAGVTVHCRYRVLCSWPTSLHSGRITRADVLLQGLQRTPLCWLPCCTPRSTWWCGADGDDSRWGGLAFTVGGPGPVEYVRAPSVTSPPRCGRCGCWMLVGLCRHVRHLFAAGAGRCAARHGGSHGMSPTLIACASLVLMLALIWAACMWPWCWLVVSFIGIVAHRGRCRYCREFTGTGQPDAIATSLAWCRCSCLTGFLVAHADIAGRRVRGGQPVCCGACAAAWGVATVASNAVFARHHGCIDCLGRGVHPRGSARRCGAGLPPRFAVGVVRWIVGAGHADPAQPADDSLRLSVQPVRWATCSPQASCRACCWRWPTPWASS